MEKRRHSTICEGEFMPIKNSGQAVSSLRAYLSSLPTYLGTCLGRVQRMVVSPPAASGTCVANNAGWWNKCQQDLNLRLCFYWDASSSHGSHHRQKSKRWTMFLSVAWQYQIRGSGSFGCELSCHPSFSCRFCSIKNDWLMDWEKNKRKRWP